MKLEFTECAPNRWVDKYDNFAIARFEYIKKGFTTVKCDPYYNAYDRRLLSRRIAIQCKTFAEAVAVCEGKTGQDVA